jgi:hypothetical protein
MWKTGKYRMLRHHCKSQWTPKKYLKPILYFSILLHCIVHWLLQVMFPSACSFIVCWFPLSFTTCFGLHGHLQACRILLLVKEWKPKYSKAARRRKHNVQCLKPNSTELFYDICRKNSIVEKAFQRALPVYFLRSLWRLDSRVQLLSRTSLSVDG